MATKKKAVMKRPQINPIDKAKPFIGIKMVKAVPMTLGAYNKFRGWDMPENEEPKNKGFLIMYPGETQPDGKDYISWSPEMPFQHGYMPTTKMDFSAALTCLKAGMKVARKGWNGKRMWIMMVPGTENASLKKGTPYHKALNTKNTGQSHVSIGAHIDMYTAQGIMQPGWLASQNDMFAEDWMVVG